MEMEMEEKVENRRNIKKFKLPFDFAIKAELNRSIRRVIS